MPDEQLTVENYLHKTEEDLKEYLRKRKEQEDRLLATRAMIEKDMGKK